MEGHQLLSHTKSSYVDACRRLKRYAPRPTSLLSSPLLSSPILSYPILSYPRARACHDSPFEDFTFQIGQDFSAAKRSPLPRAIILSRLGLSLPSSFSSIASERKRTSAREIDSNGWILDGRTVERTDGRTDGWKERGERQSRVAPPPLDFLNEPRLRSRTIACLHATRLRYVCNNDILSA